MSSLQPPDSQSFIRSLARGLGVIEALGGEQNGLSLSELAVRCELDRATIRRILLTLEQLGYVRSEGNRNFLAPRALSLGYAYLSSVPFWQVAKPLMTKLVDEVQESCSAATLDGPHAVYVIRIRSDQRIVDVSRTVGSRIPAYCTSLGRALLAGEPPALQQKLLNQLPLVAQTPQTVTDRAELLRILAEVGQQGWALVDQELEPGLISLAVPIRNAAGKTVAALNISVQAVRVSAKELKRQYLGPLQRTAQEISDAYIARAGGSAGPV